MSKPYGIILLGANGSGKFTRGRELVRVVNFAHFDAENYYWHRSERSQKIHIAMQNAMQRKQKNDL